MEPIAKNALKINGGISEDENRFYKLQIKRIPRQRHSQRVDDIKYENDYLALQRNPEMLQNEERLGFGSSKTNTIVKSKLAPNAVSGYPKF